MKKEIRRFSYNALYGSIDGIVTGLDPAGAIIGNINPNILTYGGIHDRGENRENIDINSFEYQAAKAIGDVIGLAVNVAAVWFTGLPIPQIMMIFPLNIYLNTLHKDLIKKQKRLDYVND